MFILCFSHGFSPGSLGPGLAGSAVRPPPPARGAADARRRAAGRRAAAAAADGGAMAALVDAEVTLISPHYWSKDGERCRDTP